MSTLPAYWSDEFTRGSDYDKTFLIADGESPADLTEAAVTISLTDRYGAVSTYTLADTPENVVVAEPISGQVQFLLSEVETAEFAHGCLDFKLTVAFPSGLVTTYFVGVLCGGC